MGSVYVSRRPRGRAPLSVVNDAASDTSMVPAPQDAEENKDVQVYSSNSQGKTEEICSELSEYRIGLKNMSFFNAFEDNFLQKTLSSIT